MHKERDWTVGAGAVYHNHLEMFGPDEKILLGP